jgi:hypothetical protein
MLRSAVTFVLCLSIALPATAVTVAPLTFEQLVNNSAAVVLARVVDVRGEFISGGRGIESVITVDVLKGLKGSAEETLQFTVPGGQAGRYLNVIPGAPIFSAGDLAVVFLTSRGARLPVTTGLTQGVYRVQSSGGQFVVMPPIVETGKLLGRGDVRRKPVALASFEASVRGAMGRAR